MSTLLKTCQGHCLLPDKDQVPWRDSKVLSGLAPPPPVASLHIFCLHTSCTHSCLDLLPTHSSTAVVPRCNTIHPFCLFVSFLPSKLDSNVIYSMICSVTFPQDNSPPPSIPSFLPPPNPSPLSTLNHSYNQASLESSLCHLLAS